MAFLLKLAAGIAAAAALLLALALAIPFMLDGEALARIAQEEVRHSLERDLQVRELRLRLLPSPTIRFAQLSLSNPAWARRGQLLQAENVSAQLEWLPLLHGRVVISAITAGQLQLNLETDEHGRNSWDIPHAKESRFDWKHMRAAEIDAARIWRRQDRKAPVDWQLQDFKAESAPGWKQLTVATTLLAHGESMQAKLKLNDASRLGLPGASSEGELMLQTRGARLQLSGTLPLDAALENYAFKASLQADSLKAARQLAGREFRLPAARLEVRAELRREHAAHHIEHLQIKLGRQSFTGGGLLMERSGRWHLHGELAGERLEWAQATLDLGIPTPPKKPENELLPVRPLPWTMLAALLQIDAEVDTRFASLQTRGGLELAQWQSRLQWDKNAFTLADTRFELLGGRANARMQLTPRRQEMQVQLQLQNLMLEQWFARRPERTGMVSQGPMDIKADFKSHGKSWKELAANVNGPLSIRIGAASVHSKKAHEAEAMLVKLVPAFSEEQAEDVRLVCLTSELQFKDGRAQGKHAVGVRSDSSKLLLAGNVDLSQQSLGLSGRVLAAEGVTLGISTISGDVRITGPIRKPEISVEPLGVVARVGAAIVTAGLSVLATAAHDSAVSKEDPCVVAARGEGAPKSGSRAAARSADTR